MSFKVRIYVSQRGKYRAIVRLNDDGTFDMVTLESDPIDIVTLPYKERRYLEYLEEGNLGRASHKALEIGKWRGITDGAKLFCELAYKQEAKSYE